MYRGNIEITGVKKIYKTSNSVYFLRTTLSTTAYYILKSFA